MSKLGDRLLTEKTRIVVTISNFVMLVFTIISGVIFIVNWKSDIEHRVQYNENEIKNIRLDVDNGKELQIQTQTKLVEIQTDLKWIRAYMEGN
jgi:hypothetical protein